MMMMMMMMLTLRAIRKKAADYYSHVIKVNNTIFLGEKDFKILSAIHTLLKFNLFLIVEFYRATTSRWRELTLDHIHTFFTTQGHGGPARMNDQPNAGATSETTRTLNTIHTIHSYSHSNKADMIMMTK